MRWVARIYTGLHVSIGVPIPGDGGYGTWLPAPSPGRLHLYTLFISFPHSEIGSITQGLPAWEDETPEWRDTNAVTPSGIKEQEGHGPLNMIKNGVNYFLPLFSFWSSKKLDPGKD